MIIPLGPQQGIQVASLRLSVRRRTAGSVMPHRAWWPWRYTTSGGTDGTTVAYGK